MLSRYRCAPKICAPNDHLNTVSFYDALNQRIGIDDSGGGQTWTVYNGTSADALPYADFNGSGTLLIRYVSGPGMVNDAAVDELLARTSSGGATAWYLTDKLDSVRDIVSSSGSELDHIVYDSFGNILTETNASNGDRFKFAGMQFDAVMQQYFDQARWYGPALGRFLIQDPLGFAADDDDLYRYAGGSPTNLVDESGTDDSTVVVGGVGGGWICMNVYGTANSSMPPGTGTPVASRIGLPTVSLIKPIAAPSQGQISMSLPATTGAPPAEISVAATIGWKMIVDIANRLGPDPHALSDYIHDFKMETGRSPKDNLGYKMMEELGKEMASHIGKSPPQSTSIFPFIIFKYQIQTS